MEWMPELEDHWGILFVTWASKGILSSKVRLNKILSLLQREGFPIRNKFINAPMGPYDEKIDFQAEELENAKLLKIERIPKEKNDMLRYKITDKGTKYVKNDIIPILDNIPNKNIFVKNFIKVNRMFKVVKTEELIKHVHEVLYLDDPVLFYNNLKKSQKIIQNDYEKIKNNYVDFCSLNLTLLGFLEFTNESLENIIGNEWKKPFTGKNHVLYNTEQLIEVLNKQKFTKNDIFKKCIEKNECLSHPCSIMDEKLKHRFHCIEYNSDLYNIKNAINFETADFDELLET